MEKNSLEKSCKLLAIGGSAGSLDVILKLLPALHTNLPFPIIIIVHRKSTFDSALIDLLASRTRLPLKEADDKDILAPGHIYIAPADYHLLVEKDGTLSLDFSEKVNYSRPSIDVTFETAAEAYKTKLVCILLSGANSDGTEGLKVVKKYGGKVIVQNPLTAKSAYMPEHTIAEVQVDRIVYPEEIETLINSL